MLIALAIAGRALHDHLVMRPPSPLRFACWYWHRPFRLTDADERALRAGSIARLYVYAGTLVAPGGTLRLVRPQRWEAVPSCELYAVIRVHPAAHEALLAPGGAARAADLLRAAALPPAVRGLQWDADIPTARLAEYARFLAAFRRRQPPGWALSVTALPDWLPAGSRAAMRSIGWEALCEAVDEVAPQFYGNRWPERGRPPPALWETRDLVDAVRRSVAGRARVWVGLPAYGRCVVMDHRGRPLGVRHDLGPEALLEDPAWEVGEAGTRGERWTSVQRGKSAVATPVEDTLALHCSEATVAGALEAPPGTYLWFQWPRVDGLRAAVAAIGARAPAGVEGVCFFRWPVPGEPLALAPASIAAAASRESTGSVPKAALAARLARTGRTVRVTVRNMGDDSPLLGSAIVLEVVPPPGAVVLADNAVEWRRGDETTSSVLADRALFTRRLLRPGQRWDACRLEHAGDAVRVTLRWQGGDGHWYERVTVEEEG